MRCRLRRRLWTSTAPCGRRSRTAPTSRRRRTSLERNDVEHQILPQSNPAARSTRTASYRSNAVGGVFLSPVSFTSAGIGANGRRRNRGSARCSATSSTNTFPTWTVGLTLSYPLGTSSQETNLARAKLQYAQEETQLKNLEMQVTTQVRDAGRQVQTNQKRVDSARAARELAERRLEAEEKKFAAGIQISFFVFQAQRDLATGTNFRNPRHCGLQQVAGGFRGRPGNTVAITTVLRPWTLDFRRALVSA